jgi:hypothetical protein
MIARPPADAQEAMVDWISATMDAGLFVMGDAAGFLVWTAWRASRRARGKSLRVIDDHPGSRLDLFMGVLWFGMLLVQTDNLFLNAAPGGWYKLSALSLAGTASTVFICGAFAGRIVLRRELRWLQERREEKTPEAQS